MNALHAGENGIRLLLHESRCATRTANRIETCSNSVEMLAYHTKSHTDGCQQVGDLRPLFSGTTGAAYFMYPAAFLVKGGAYAVESRANVMES